MPEIEQKFLTLQCQTSQKFNLIQKTAVYISNQFETALQNLPYSKNDNFEFNFFELNEKELNKLDKNLLATLKKFDFSLLLQNLFKSFCEEIIGNFEKKIEGKIFDYLSVCESKIQKISSFISIIEMKMDMKKESLEKRMIINGKKNDSDFKNCTFEKKRSFIDDNKENLYTGNRNLIKINEKNCFEDCLKFEFIRFFKDYDFF